jgi:hypothetical protein
VFHSGPKGEAGTACEHDDARRGRLAAILRLERLDARFPSIRVVPERSGRAQEHIEPVEKLLFDFLPDTHGTLLTNLTLAVKLSPPSLLYFQLPNLADGMPARDKDSPSGVRFQIRLDGWKIMP